MQSTECIDALADLYIGLLHTKQSNYSELGSPVVIIVKKDIMKITTMQLSA